MKGVADSHHFYVKIFMREISPMPNCKKLHDKATGEH